MASKLKIKVNGLVHNVTASLDTPLLYVLHNELHLHGPRFGCGLAQCGACSVLLDGKEIRSLRDAGCGGEREGDHDAGGPAGSVGEGAGHDGGVVRRCIRCSRRGSMCRCRIAVIARTG